METAGDDPARQRQVREKHFRIELKKYMDHEIARGGDGRVLCLMDSMDHTLPAVDVPAYLRLIRETCPGVEPKHSTLPEFFREAQATVQNPPVRTGELREPSRNRSSYLWLIPNCPSARVRMKAANDECQTLLEKWADPFVAIANLRGAGIPVRHLGIAWKFLLTNHAHDSICGCSIDQIHRDMMYRFDQARVLGEQLRSQSIGFLTGSCADLARTRDEFTLTVVNPLPFAREEVVVFDVDLPVDFPAEFRESFSSPALNAFALEDGDGKLIPYQRLSYEPRTSERSRFAKFCFQSDGLETGSTTFRFRLLPFANKLPRAEALAELAKLQSGLLTRQTGPRPSGYPKMAGDEPATQGFMDCLSGNLVVSAIKTPESGEGLIVRLWNPTGQTLKEEIVFSREVVEATPALLNEDPHEAPGVLARQGNKITVLATPKKIITLRVVFRD